MAQAFYEAVRQLPDAWQQKLLCYPKEERQNVREITFRAGKPVVLTTADGIRFLDRRNRFARVLSSECVCVSAEEVEHILRHLTHYSLHTFEQDLCGGYLTIRGGHRCGVAGSAVYKAENLSHIRAVSCVSLRIARQIHGLAAPIWKRLYYGSVIPSVLLIGAPASGKTTVLRDWIRALASGETGRYMRVAVVDERGEIGAAVNGIAQNDLGITSDLLDGFWKKDGMRAALRSLAPQVIAVDEIATQEDMESLRQIRSGGAAILATAHASSMEELYHREGLKQMMEEAMFDALVVLEGAGRPGVAKTVLSLKTEETRLCG